MSSLFQEDEVALAKLALAGSGWDIVVGGGWGWATPRPQFCSMSRMDTI
jgi:hypothetical protein